MLEPINPLAELLRRDRRYRADAYFFVFDALRFAQERLGMGREAASMPLPPGMEAPGTEDDIDQLLGPDFDDEEGLDGELDEGELDDDELDDDEIDDEFDDDGLDDDFDEDDDDELDDEIDDELFDEDLQDDDDDEEDDAAFEAKLDEVLDADDDLLAPSEEGKHVSGQQLCEAIRRYALDQYGLLAKHVLGQWGVCKTDDFGEIVFNLIDIGKMRRTEEDSREDFVDVFDFEEGLVNQFRFRAPEVEASKDER